MPGPRAASSRTEEAEEALIPMTDVSIRLRIGCNNQIPKVGRPNFNKSVTVGTTGPPVVLVSNAADCDDEVADS